MKKILSLALVAVMLLSLVALTSCGEDPTPDEPTTLKFGLGVAYSVSDVKNATDEANGSASVSTTAAVVLVDDAGKIVKCAIDTTYQGQPAWDTTGTFIVPTDFATKYELGFDYHMVAYGGGQVTKEWFEQVDGFCSAVVGKTVAEVKAMVAENGYPNSGSDIVTAGCTIGVADFVVALEKAVNNAAASNATADSTLKLGIATSTDKVKNATAEADGSMELNSTIVATALDASGKIVVAKTDCTQSKVTVTAAGECTSNSIKSKYELGADYNMVAYGHAAKEWFEQADAFSAQLIGKTAAEIAGLVVADTGKGNDAVIAAGCTIVVTDMVKAAVKAATV